jgi:hypothetical protein
MTLDELIKYYILPPEFILMMNTDKSQSREMVLSIIIEELIDKSDVKISPEHMEPIKLLLSKVYDIGYYDGVTWTFNMMDDGFDEPLTQHELKEE